MNKYQVIIEERCETLALVVAKTAKQARELAKHGDYDLLPKTSKTLTNRIRKVILIKED